MLHAHLVKHHPFDAAVEGQEEEDAADEADGCSMTADGWAVLRGTRECYVDPWDTGCNNVVSSKLTVEVVEVELAE